MSTILPLTRAQRLAQSSRPLADLLAKLVRLEAAIDSNGSSEDSDDPESPQAPLEPMELEKLPDGSAYPDVMPSRYGAAVLLGRALDRHREELAHLQDGDAVTIIEVLTSDMVEPVAALLKRQVIGEPLVLSRTRLRVGGIGGPTAHGAAAIFRDPEAARSSSSEDAEDLIAAARQRCSLIGVSAEPARLLPAELVRMADRKISVGAFDGEGIRSVVRLVTGDDPGPIDSKLAASVTLKMLDLAIKRDLGATGSIRRLERLAGVAKAEPPAVRIEQMHGLGPAKKWALDLTSDLKAYARGELAWSSVPRGAVLWSRPGCGKTALARALARQASCGFIATSYAQWQSFRDGHLGSVTQAIRKTFSEAKRMAPCIVFIDEIDTLGTRGTGRDADWWRAIINTLLEELDGFNRRAGVVVIGACNDAERLDPALVRAGRLDTMIEIPLPDVPDLVGIFRDYLGAELTDATLLDVALAAFGGTGADVERWVREARATARRSGRDLSKDDLLRVVRGSKGELPLAVRRRVAYHEAGHAIATVATGLGRPVSLSIGGGGGLSQNEPGERRALTRAHIETHLMILLAGRAAEILIFGEATAGSGGADDSDLARATWLAERLETVYGLGGSGLVYMPAEGHRLLLDSGLRKGIEKTLDRIQTATSELLARNRGCLDALAAALYEKGYMSADEIGRLLEKVPPQPWVHAASGPRKAAMSAPSADSKHDDLEVGAQP